MLKKLLYYEYLSVRRYLLPLLALTPAFALIVGLIGYASSRVENAVIQISLSTMYVFAMIALVLSVGLLPVLLVVRYWSGLYGDSGYLTLLLPVSRKKILLSKVLGSIVMTLIYLVVAFFSIGFAYGASLAYAMGHGPFYAFSVTFETIKALFSTVPGGVSAFMVVEFVIYLIFMLSFMFNLLYTGVTLGAAIFQGKARIAGAVLFCFVSYTIWSTVKTIIEGLLSGGIILLFSLDAMMDAATFQFFLIVEAVLYAGFSVGLFFFNAKMVDKKLNLT